jgi:hypothetical protein
MGEHIPGRVGGDIQDAVAVAAGDEEAGLRTASPGDDIQDAVSAASGMAGPRSRRIVVFTAPVGRQDMTRYLR